MFVFRRQDLPADPVFPAELDKLGYCINDKDQIRKISDPTQEFQYKINKNDRWNEVQRAAMNGKYFRGYRIALLLKKTIFRWVSECIREIVLSRLRDLGLVTLRLPLVSGPTKPHVPVMVSRNLSSASRIIIVFGEPVQDLGIWAYRTVGSEGINAGSAVDFVKAILNASQNVNIDSTNEFSAKAQFSQKGEVAVVLANTGQLVWHCGLGRAMTINSRLALPRPSAVDPPLAETNRNKIPGNSNWQEHVNSVFDGIFATRGQLIRKDAKIDVIGLAEGGLGAIRYLASNWDAWRQHISAMCLATPLHTKSADLLDADGKEPTPDSFAAFVSSRCRAYLLSQEPLGFPLAEDQAHGCNCYASGEDLNAECIMPKTWPQMLNWLNHAYDNPDYCEEQLVVREIGAEDFAGKSGDMWETGSRLGVA
ncbi:Arb2 domain-containing protein [Aspergillus aurantiobrunneus]